MDAPCIKAEELESVLRRVPFPQRKDRVRKLLIWLTLVRGIKVPLAKYSVRLVTSMIPSEGRKAFKETRSYERRANTQGLSVPSAGYVD